MDIERRWNVNVSTASIHLVNAYYMDHETERQRKGHIKKIKNNTGREKEGLVFQQNSSHIKILAKFQE